MNLPFTTEQFLEVFATYNNAIWPFQFVLNVTALAVIILAIRRSAHSDQAISISLGFLWLWMGLVYHLTFFSSINPAAYVFGLLFALQGVLFFWVARKGQVTYHASTDWRSTVGSLFIVYGLVIYPILGMNLGHVYPHAPTFGAPCPTTIFTFGILLWGTGIPRYLIVIPAVWSMIGFSAAFTLGIKEDIGLLVAGIASTLIILFAKPAVRIVESNPRSDNYQDRT